MTMRFMLAGSWVIAFGIAGCATGASPSPAAGTPSPAAVSPSAAATTVQVTLQEWAVVPASTSVPAGDIIFQVSNKGPEDVHEFVVLKTDLDPGALPTDATGAVTEEGTGIVVVDEIEDIAVGKTQELKVSLAAGKYVLICNIYDETKKEGHYKSGMRIAFTVTG